MSLSQLVRFSLVFVSVLLFSTSALANEETTALLKEARSQIQQGNLAGAVDFFRKAAYLGDTEANEEMLNLISSGSLAVLSGEQDASSGVRHFNFSVDPVTVKESQKIESFLNYGFALQAMRFKIFSKELPRGNDTYHVSKSAFKRAADMGSSEAWFYLGNMTSSFNKQEAAIYYQNAVNLGHLEALAKLASVTEGDSRMGAYRSAAKRNHMQSAVTLGQAYLDGSDSYGLKKDLKEAFKWLQLARRNSFIDSRFSRANLTKFIDEKIKLIPQDMQVNQADSFVEEGKTYLAQSNHQEARNAFRSAAVLGSLEGMDYLLAMLEKRELIPAYFGPDGEGSSLKDSMLIEGAEAKRAKNYKLATEFQKRAATLEAIKTQTMMSAHSAQAGDHDYDVQVELEIGNLGKYVGPMAPPIQLSVKRSRQDIEWSFDEPRSRSGRLEAVQSLHHSDKLAPGLMPWRDGKGFSFQVAGLAILVGWDGTVYLKHEGRPVTSSISLRTYGKVVLLDGSFQEKLRVRSEGLGFPKSIVLEDFDWDGVLGKAGLGKVVIEKESTLEVRKFKIAGFIDNYGTIKMMEQARVGGSYFHNYGTITGGGIVDFYSFRNLSQVFAKAPLLFDDYSFVNLGRIYGDDKIEIKANSVDNQKATIEAKDLVILKGGLTNTGYLKARNKLEISGLSVTNFASATLLGEQGIQLEASGSVGNSGQILSAADIQFKASTIEVSKGALLSADGNFQLVAVAGFTNNGIIQSKLSYVGHRTGPSVTRGIRIPIPGGIRD